MYGRLEGAELSAGRAWDSPTDGRLELVTGRGEVNEGCVALRLAAAGLRGGWSAYSRGRRWQIWGVECWERVVGCRSEAIWKWLGSISRRWGVDESQGPRSESTFEICSELVGYPREKHQVVCRIKSDDGILNVGWVWDIDISCKAWKRYWTLNYFRSACLIEVSVGSTGSIDASI